MPGRTRLTPGLVVRTITLRRLFACQEPQHVDSRLPRAGFSVTRGRAYLNSAAEGIPPLQVEQALRSYFADHVLGMDGRIAHAAGTTRCANRWARCTGCRRPRPASAPVRPRRTTSRRSHCDCEPVTKWSSTISTFPPVRRRGCRRIVRRRSRYGGIGTERLRTEDLVPLLGPKTKFVNVSLVSYFNGFRLALPPVIELVRRHSPRCWASTSRKRWGGYRWTGRTWACREST